MRPKHKLKLLARNSGKNAQNVNLYSKIDQISLFLCAIPLTRDYNLDKKPDTDLAFNSVKIPLEGSNSASKLFLSLYMTEGIAPTKYRYSVLATHEKAYITRNSISYVQMQHGVGNISGSTNGII